MLPPNLEQLRERLVSRGTETNEQINNRIMRASSEIEKSGKFDYKIVLDNIDTQVKKFKDIICSETNKRK
jgi:guanylate kinase